MEKRNYMSVEQSIANRSLLSFKQKAGNIFNQPNYYWLLRKDSPV
jgi:hypothetical protein